MFYEPLAGHYGEEGAAVEAEMKAATRASAVSATVAAFEDLDDEAKAAVMDKLK